MQELAALVPAPQRVTPGGHRTQQKDPPGYLLGIRCKTHLRGYTLHGIITVQSDTQEGGLYTMAAPQWSGGKCKSIQQAKAFFRHNSTERRKDTQHTNPHIDKSKTHLNFSCAGLTYKGRCDAYDARMSEIDMGKPGSGKNARTVMQSVIIYPPAALVNDKAKLRAWFKRAWEKAVERFGPDAIDMAVDFDEVHEYTEPKTGRQRVSLEHGHLWLVPEVGGKLNGKQFSSRAVINGFNAELQAMSLAEFGCPMMDGSKAKGGQTVEQLKAQSEAAAIVAEAEAQREAAARFRVWSEAAAAKELKTAQEAAEAIRSAAEAQAGEILAEAEKARQEAQEARKRAVSDSYRGFMRRRVPGYDQLEAEFVAEGYKQLRQAPADPQPQRTRGKKKQQPAHQSEAPAAAPKQQPAPLELDAAAQARIQGTLASLGYQPQPSEAGEDYQL